MFTERRGTAADVKRAIFFYSAASLKLLSAQRSSGAWMQFTVALASQKDHKMHIFAQNCIIKALLELFDQHLQP